MWLLSQRTLSVIMLSLGMNSFINTKPSDNLTFVNLKTFLNEHFNNTPYLIVVENDNYLQTIQDGKLSTGVYAQDRVIDCNLRVLDTYMPEYLLFIMQRSDNNVSIRTAIQQSCKTSLPNIPNDLMPTFLEYKMFHYLEAIICSNFSREVWRGVWQRDRCYVVKNNSELEYYTVYDYKKLVVNLLDWLFIAKTTENNVWSFTLFLKAMG
jgi:hypothetical protein